MQVAPLRTPQGPGLGKAPVWMKAPKGLAEAPKCAAFLFATALDGAKAEEPLKQIIVQLSNPKLTSTFCQASFLAPKSAKFIAGASVSLQPWPLHRVTQLT